MHLSKLYFFDETKIHGHTADSPVPKNSSIATVTHILSVFFPTKKRMTSFRHLTASREHLSLQQIFARVFCSSKTRENSVMRCKSSTPNCHSVHEEVDECRNRRERKIYANGPRQLYRRQPERAQSKTYSKRV
jgi:hypothetical protein